MINTSSLSPEWSLLLQCCKARFSSTPLVIDPKIAKSINWQAVYQLAQRQSILPLLNSIINSNSLDDQVPDRIRAQAKQQQFRIATNNLQSTQELLTLIRVFRQEG
ncbi:MAG: nucleotidyltransferase family protein, partial [Saprospiraceae bacterium]